jgi:phage gp36-like protein
MAYTLPSDVKQVMRKLPSSVTDADIQFHAEKATAYINGLLGKVFVTPFTEPVPPLIKHIATDLTVFFLAEDLYSSNQPNLDEYHQKRYERVMKMLGELMDGTLDIGIPRIDKGDASGFASTNEVDPVFTLDLPQW